MTNNMENTHYLCLSKTSDGFRLSQGISQLLNKPGKTLFIVASRTWLRKIGPCYNKWAEVEKILNYITRMDKVRLDLNVMDKKGKLGSTLDHL